MSLANCFKHSKLDSEVIAKLKKDISKQIKKGIDKETAERTAINKLIEDTKNEIENVRDQLPESLNTQEIKISNARESNQLNAILNQGDGEYYQSQAKRNAGIQIPQNEFALPDRLKNIKITLPTSIDTNKTGRENLQNIRTDGYLNKHTKEIISVTENTLGKIGSEIGFKINSDLAMAKVYKTIMADIDKVINESIYFEKSTEDYKGKNRNFKYFYSLVNVNGKDYIVQLQVNNGELYNIKIDKLNLKERGAASNQVNSTVAPDASSTPTESPLTVSLSDFKEIFKSVISKNKYFQSSKSENQGSVQFRWDGATVIRLFNLENKSTFMHEMGHVFLEGLFNRVMSGDGTAKEMRQWESISKWLQFDPNNQQALTVEQHEQFARGFELYLMEGKAPTKELQNAFTKFRKWLVSWYKKASSLDVSISDDVRGVFNSMLVTDAAIKQSNLESGIELADIQKTLGEDITEKVKQKLIDLKEQAEEEAFSKIYKEQFKLLGQEHKEALKQKQKDLRIKYTEEVQNSELGIDIQNQREVLGVKDLGKLAEKILNNKLTDKQVDELEYKAELLGFSSLDHMAKVLLSQKTVEQIVDQKVQNDLNELESKKDPSFIKDEAMKKIRNEYSVELMALEKEILLKKVQNENEKELNRLADAMDKDNQKLIQDWLIAKESHKLTNKFTQKLEVQKNKYEKEIDRLNNRAIEKENKYKQAKILREWLDAKNENEKRKQAALFRDSIKELSRSITGLGAQEAEKVKEKAKEFLHDKPYKEAIKFQKYFNAEKIAAVKLASAIKENNWQKALEAKHEQMLNHALARESVRMYKQTEKINKYLNSVRTDSRESFKNEDHWHQASKILDRFGFTRSDFDADFSGMSLKEWAETYEEKTNIVNIADWLLNESVSIHPSAITFNQLNDVKDSIKNIKKVASLENRTLKVMDGVNIDSIIKDLINISKNNISKKDRYKANITDTFLDKRKAWFRKYFTSLETTETIAHKLDGFKDNGKWSTVFWKTVYNAANDESKMFHEAKDSIKNLWSAYSPKELKELRNKKIFIEDLGVSIEREKLLAMALNLGNEGNRDRLFETAPVGFDQEKWNEFNVMNAIQNNLTEKDWRFVQDTWDLLESYWPKIKKLHKELTGFSPGKVKPLSFSVISQGKQIDLKGGYYPLKEDSRGSYEAESKDIADTPLYSEKNPAWKASTKTGHTKQRTGGQYSLSLDTGIISKHLIDVIHDLSFRPTIIDLRRIIESKDIQNEVKSALGPEGYSILRQWVSSCAGRDMSVTPASDFTTSGLAHLKKSTTAYMLGLNFKNIMQNMSNVSLYGGSVEGFSHADVAKAMYRGMNHLANNVLSNDMSMSEFVFEKSQFMRDKSDSPEFSIKEATDKAFGENSLLSEYSQRAMAFTDNLTALPVWMEAYSKKIDEGMSEKDAIAFADLVIYRSVGSGRKYDQSEVFRSGETQKIFLMFYSFTNNMYNRWVRENGYLSKNKDIPKYLAFLTAQIAFVFLGEALMGRVPDKDEEMPEWIIKNILNYPMSFFPFIRDIGPAAMDKIVWNKPGAAYRPSPIFELFNTGMNAGQAIASDKVPVENKIEELAKVPMMLTGTPKQFSDWFWNLHDIGNGMDAKPSDLYKRRPKKER